MRRWLSVWPRVYPKLPENANPEEHDYELYEPQEFACTICHSEQDVVNENEILLCDKCDAPYHQKCVQPPVASIPEGDWFCPQCTNAAKAEEHSTTLRDDENVFAAPRAATPKRRQQSEAPKKSKRAHNRNESEERKSTSAKKSTKVCSKGTEGQKKGKQPRSKLADFKLESEQLKRHRSLGESAATTTSISTTNKPSNSSKTANATAQGEHSRHPRTAKSNVGAKRRKTATFTSKQSHRGKLFPSKGPLSNVAGGECKQNTENFISSPDSYAAKSDDTVPQLNQLRHHKAHRTDQSINKTGKACRVCKFTNPEAVVRCDECQDSFHEYCLLEPISDVSKPGWLCNACSMRRRFEDGLAIVTGKKPRPPSTSVGNACEICGSDEDLETNQIILCDACGAGYHQFCLNPVVPSVPVLWWCPPCDYKRKLAENKPTEPSSEKGACHVCHSSADEDSNALLICDNCDIACHQFCLIPVLYDPPRRWLCDLCHSIEESEKHGVLAGKRPPICQKCKRKIGVERLVCHQCANYFHLSCASELHTPKSATWTCIECSGTVSMYHSFLHASQCGSIRLCS